MPEISYKRATQFGTMDRERLSTTIRVIYKIMILMDGDSCRHYGVVGEDSLYIFCD